MMVIRAVLGGGLSEPRIVLHQLPPELIIPINILILFLHPTKELVLMHQQLISTKYSLWV